MVPPTFGRAVRRVEDPRLVTGAGTYVDDLQPAGLVHALFFRSYLAHAVIRRLDVAEARRAPRVPPVWTPAHPRGPGAMATGAPPGGPFAPRRRAPAQRPAP